AELWRAITERSDRGVCKIAAVVEPLDTASARKGSGVNRGFAIDAWKREAVRSRPATKRTGFVLRSIDRQRPACTERHDGTNLPAGHDGVQYSVHVFANRFTAANRQLVDGVACEHMSSVVIARRPFCLAVVNVLPVCRCAEGVVPSPVVTSAVRHALG